jgi:high-affinity Fe2+/Pb2+ permease
MESQNPSHSFRVRQSTRLLALWTLIWLVSTALSTFGPIFLWDNATILSSLSICLTTVLGLVLVYVNMRYLNTIDELQRKLQLDAMAVALGISIVLGLSYSKLEIAKVISFHAEIGHIVILFSTIYLFVLLRGIKKIS